MNPQISVIVPIQAKQDLSRILTSLAKQTLPLGQFEVLIVVDGEGRVDLEWQNAVPVRVINQAKSGGAAARNRGAAESKGDLLVFLEAGVSATPDLLRLYQQAHHQAQEIVAFGTVKIDPASADTFLKRWTENQQVKYFEDWFKRKPTAPYYFTRANFSIRKATLFRSGGFDEQFKDYGCEQADLGIRLKQAGVDFLYVPDAVVSELSTNHWPAASGNLAKERGRNEILLIQKHPFCRLFSNMKSSYFQTFTGKLFLRLVWHLPALMKITSRLIPGKLARFRARYTIHYCIGVKESGITIKELKALFGQKVVVLGYHDIVADHEHPHRFDVSRSLFKKQMMFLQRTGFQSITLQQFLNWLNQNTPLPNKPVLITIDDGYTSLRTEVYPVLKQLDFDAVVFLCPALMGKENTWDQQRGMSKKSLLDWSEIAALADFSVGAHSMSHQDLRTMAPAALKEDLESCRNEIAIRTAAPLAFSYPFGAFDDGSIEAVQAAGFDCAFTAHEGFNFFDTNRFLLRRVMIERSDMLPFFRIKVKLGRGLLDRWKDRAYGGFKKALKYLCFSTAPQPNHG